MPQHFSFNSLKAKLCIHYIFLLLLTAFSVKAGNEDETLNNIHQKLMEANSLKLQADYILNNATETIGQQHLKAYSLLYQSYTIKQQVYANMLNQLINKETITDSTYQLGLIIQNNANRLLESSAETMAIINQDAVAETEKINKYKNACDQLSIATTGYQIVYDIYKKNDPGLSLTDYASEDNITSLSDKYEQNPSSLLCLFHLDTPDTTPEKKTETDNNVAKEAQPITKVNPVTTSEVTYVIQVAASRDKLIPQLLAHFRKKTNGNLREVREGGWYKYQYVVGPSYETAHQKWLEFGTTVSFPVAYLNGKRISIKKALSLTNNN